MDTRQSARERHRRRRRVRRRRDIERKRNVQRDTARRLERGIPRHGTFVGAITRYFVRDAAGEKNNEFSCKRIREHMSDEINFQVPFRRRVKSHLDKRTYLSTKLIKAMRN